MSLTWYVFGIERAANADCLSSSERYITPFVYWARADVSYRSICGGRNWNTHTALHVDDRAKAASPKLHVRCCYRGPVGLLRRILWKASRSSSPHLPTVLRESVLLQIRASMCRIGGATPHGFLRLNQERSRGARNFPWVLQAAFKKKPEKKALAVAKQLLGCCDVPLPLPVPLPCFALGCSHPPGYTEANGENLLMQR